MAFVFGVSLAIANPKHSHDIASRDVPTRRATFGLATRSVARPEPRRAVTASAHLARREVIFGTSSAALIASQLASRAVAGTIEYSEPLIGKVVSKAYAEFAVGDIPGVLETFAPNIKWEPTTPKGRPYKARYSGVAGAQEFFTALGDNETVTQFDVTNIVAQGDTAVGLINWTATVKKTGKSYSLVLIHKWTIDDEGLLSSFKEYFSDDAACTAAFGG